MRVSIPQGTIKSYALFEKLAGLKLFQFHKVRLKDRLQFPNENPDYRFNSTRYD